MVNIITLLTSAKREENSIVKSIETNALKDCMLIHLQKIDTTDKDSSNLTIKVSTKSIVELFNTIINDKIRFKRV